LSISIFSCPKAFEGLYDVIQRNAIKSWLALKPTPEIILFGDDLGTAEVCEEYAMKNVPVIDCNEFGTPIVSSIFNIAQSKASYPIMCYVNADIILLQDFLNVIHSIDQRLRFYLLIGQRWDMEISELLSFNSHLEGHLKNRVRREGQLHNITGKDFFVFRKGLYEQIPPFAIGRGAWDDWLVFWACKQKAAVVDLTKAVTVIHQNHDYSHVVTEKNEKWKGIEADRNLALAGSSLFSENRRTISDANYRLIEGELLRQPNLYRVYRGAWRFLSKYYMILKRRKIVEQIGIDR
jgi:hypothetical protein